jgi:enoyl-CoA hydratase/carnithine racemase
MACQSIACEKSDGVLTITLNRPDKLNAFTLEMGREIIDVFDRADAGDEVRAVIVTGAGRAFCAGGPLAWRHHLRPHRAPRPADASGWAGRRAGSQ